MMQPVFLQEFLEKAFIPLEGLHLPPLRSPLPPSFPPPPAPLSLALHRPSNQAASAPQGPLVPVEESKQIIYNCNLVLVLFKTIL